MVAVEHLPFSFGEKVDFINYCQRAFNLASYYVPRAILIRTVFVLYKKKEKIFDNFFLNILMVVFPYVPTYGVIISNFILTWMSPSIILIIIEFYKKNSYI